MLFGTVLLVVIKRLPINMVQLFFFFFISFYLRRASKDNPILDVLKYGHSY